MHWGRHPPSQWCWDTHTSRQTPPLPPDDHCSGRYASYCNAFLFFTTSTGAPVKRWSTVCNFLVYNFFCFPYRFGIVTVNQPKSYVSCLSHSLLESTPDRVHFFIPVDLYVLPEWPPGKLSAILHEKMQSKHETWYSTICTYALFTLEVCIFKV